MRQKKKTDQVRRAPGRIVALLFSFAVIAEFAAAMPAPARRLALFFLRRAEQIAYSHVYWAARAHGLSLPWALPETFRNNSDYDAAMMLGWWFRILAIALRDLPRRAYIEKRRRPTVMSCGALESEEPALAAASSDAGEGCCATGPPLQMAINF